MIRDNKENKEKNNIGTIFGIAELVKELFGNRPKKEEKTSKSIAEWKTE